MAKPPAISPNLPCAERAMCGLFIYSPEARSYFKANTANLRNPWGLFESPVNRAVAEVLVRLPDDVQGMPQAMEACFSTHQLHATDPFVPMDYLGKCSADVFDLSMPSGFPEFESNFRVLLERARRRAVARESESLTDQIMRGGDLEAIVQASAANMRKIIAQTDGLVSPSSERMDALLESMLESGTSLDAIPATHMKLNAMTSAWQRGQVSLIAAPPGAGKTAFLLREAFAALEAGKTVWAWLSESSEQQVFARYCGIVHGVSNEAWKQKNWSAENLATVRTAREQFAAFGNRFAVLYRQPRSGEQVESDLLSYTSHCGPPDMVIVDHLQTMEAPAGCKSASHEHGAVHANTMALWRAAAQTGAATLVASQMTKESLGGYGEGRRKRPTLGAIKASGAPVEKAKLVLFLHEPEDTDADMAPMELVVAKCNDGRLGHIPAMYCRPMTMWLEDTDENRVKYHGLIERYKEPDPEPKRKGGRYG